MIREKIDEFLSSKIKAQNFEDVFECLVRTKDENCLKKYIKKFGNRVVSEYPFTNTFSAVLSEREIF